VASLLVASRAGSNAFVHRAEEAPVEKPAEKPAEKPVEKPEEKKEDKVEEKSDPAVDTLDLQPKAKKVANKLKTTYTDISFTSGKRDETEEQASAMASNVVSNRNWITETYVDKALSKALQTWLDDNPKAKTKDEIAAGLKGVMDGWTEKEKGRLSAHFTGEAFDIQPQDAKASEIKRDAKSWSEAEGGKFLEKEGGLVRWHTEIRE
jgi:hypothetical protein